MTATEPVQTPVTGLEDPGGHSDVLGTLSQFYRALNSRDLQLMEQNWDHSSEAAMDNPLGGIKRGWKDIKPTYEKLFASKGQYRFEFYDYTLHEVGELFYVIGRERGELQIGEQKLQLAIRTTRLFQKDNDGRWRQKHHHGSIDDAKMLAAYQQAVLGQS